MATFLNREGILKHFNRLFKEANKELIMIVPYIKLSSDIIEKIREANDRGLQILIVYREKSLNDEQKSLLFSFENITILYHPNVHAKCYLNERSLIIGSMNLYENSMKNNREMGVLLDYFKNDTETSLSEQTIDDRQPLKDAIEEIKIILNSSTQEKTSPYIKKNGFTFNILKNRNELLEDLIFQLNSLSGNKRFQTVQDDQNNKNIVCLNFFENTDLYLETVILFDEKNIKHAWVKNIYLQLKHPESQLQKIFNSFGKSLDEFSYKQYKTYWNWHKSPIKIYRDSKQFPEIWENIDILEQTFILIKGAEKIIVDLKKEKQFLKIN